MKKTLVLGVLAALTGVINGEVLPICGQNCMTTALGPYANIAYHCVSQPDIPCYCANDGWVTGIRECLVECTVNDRRITMDYLDNLCQDATKPGKGPNPNLPPPFATSPAPKPTTTATATHASS